MKLVLDFFKDLELKEFLLTQDGIKSVDIINNKHFSKVIIDYDEKINDFIVYNYIKLYLDDVSEGFISFAKNVKFDTNILNYNIEQLCCEFCYKRLIEELFKNNNIKSVKSNFDNNNFRNVELVIEYKKDYNEEELIEFIKKNIK